MKNDGKGLELLVNMIQKSIEPDAIVRHDVHLPVIGSTSNRKRQCDIVIESGPKHRKTLTIVEVQDRKSQVDINTFSGWLDKLDEVGAQHLVCVSRLEFPESIKEKAISKGNKVKLINLKDANPTEIPLKTIFRYYNYQLERLNSPEIIFSGKEVISLGIQDSLNLYLKNKDVDINSLMYSLNKKDLKSIYTLCRDSNENLDIEGSGNDIIEFDRINGEPLFFTIDGIFTRIGMKLEFGWKNEIIEYPVTILSYEQQFDGSLAWIFEGKCDTPEGTISFKMPVIKKDNGHQISGVILKVD